MRGLLASMLLGAVCAGCGSTPEAVKPTLKALAQLGYGCGDGERELGPPNGLYMWHCNRSNPGSTSIVLVEGNDRGIATISIDVADTDPALAREAFAEFVASVAPLATVPGLGDGLDGWTGLQASRDINGVGVTGLCDATQCIVFVGMTPAPIQAPDASNS